MFEREQYCRCFAKRYLPTDDVWDREKGFLERSAKHKFEVLAKTTRSTKDPLFSTNFPADVDDRKTEDLFDPTTSAGQHADPKRGVGIDHESR